MRRGLLVLVALFATAVLMASPAAAQPPSRSLRAYGLAR
jgi:hypothetical protein